jgi:hypothetical protein
MRPHLMTSKNRPTPADPVRPGAACRTGLGCEAEFKRAVYPVGGSGSFTGLQLHDARGHLKLPLCLSRRLM